MLFYCMNLWLLMFQSNFVYRVSILYMNHEAIHIVTFIDMILQYCKILSITCRLYVSMLNDIFLSE